MLYVCDESNEGLHVQEIDSRNSNLNRNQSSMKVVWTGYLK